MGRLESNFRRRRKRADIQALVLRTVAVAGIISTALVAPGVLGAMAKLGLIPKHRQETIIQISRRRLIERGLLIREGNQLRLSAKGARSLRLIEARHTRLRKPPRWDKRWRVLIFDIPERKKGMRDKMRRTLQSVGFVRLQDSVWIYPYPCEDFITLLKADFKIGKDVLYMIVDTLEYDQPVRAKFGLD